MDTRVAILAIVVEERDKAEELNHVLHAYGKYIIGRMGIPYEKRDLTDQRRRRCTPGCDQCHVGKDRQY